MSHSAIVSPFSRAMQCVHPGGSLSAKGYVVEAMAGVLGKLGFDVTPGRRAALLGQTNDVRQLALQCELYDGCTGDDEEEVGISDLSAAQFCCNFQRDVMASHGATPHKNDLARYNEYRKAILRRLEALLGMLSPAQRAMEDAKVLMGMAKYLQSPWFGAEAVLNSLRGRDLGSVLVSAAIGELFQLLKITPKDILRGLHERFADLFNEFPHEYVVLPLMPDGYKKDLANVNEVLCVNPSPLNMGHCLETFPRALEDIGLCDTLARAHPTLPNQSQEEWPVGLFIAFVFAMRGGATFRDYGGMGQNMCFVKDGAGAEMMQKVLQHAEDQALELKISEEDLAKAKNDMSRALPNEEDDEETGEDQTGEESGSEEEVDTTNDTRCRKRSRSPSQNTARALCLQGMAEMGVKGVKGFSQAKLQKLANLAACAAGDGKDPEVVIPSEVLSMRLAQAEAKLMHTVSSGGEETDPERLQEAAEPVLAFLAKLNEEDLLSDEVYPLICQTMHCDPNGTFALLKGLKEHPNTKKLVEIAALAYQNSILAVPPGLGRHLTSEVVTKVARTFPQLRCLKSEWLDDNVVRAALTCNKSLALRGMRAEQVHALQEKFGNIIDEMESECVQDRKSPRLEGVEDTAPEY